MADARASRCEFCVGEVDAVLWGGHLVCEVHEHEVRKFLARNDEGDVPPANAVARYRDARRRRRNGTPQPEGSIGELLHEELDRWHELSMASATDR